MRWLIVIVVVACSSKSGTRPPQPPANKTTDNCPAAVDKIFALLAKKGAPIDPAQRDAVIDQCRRDPSPLAACVVAAADDAAVEACMTPKPKGEPGDQLDAAAENLRTYFFVNETFTDTKVPLTPAKPCCQFPNKKCPAEAKPNEYLADVLKLDFTKERSFQYRFESTATKAVVEAIGDRDCDGKTVTYRREVEHRDDGNMHITVIDPPLEDD